MKYLLHVDGKLPNMALMRLSSYWKAQGEQVTLVRAVDGRIPAPDLFTEPGEVYASSIFTFSDKARATYERLWGRWGRITWGGTGVAVSSSLAEIDPTVDWEAVPLDYSPYADFEPSIGMLSRGCTLRCKFCCVPEKEGGVQTVRTVGEIYRGEPHKRWILLLDNDFFGQPEEAWRARVAELRAGNFKVCFSQGINIRQITPEAAAALATLEYRDNAFQTRVLYTAWDNLGDEKRFKAGVEMLAAAGVPPKHLRVYMLIGYAKTETWESILYRFNEMVALGCEPYPMAYDRSRGDLLAFQRWAIRGLYHHVPWEKYLDPRLAPYRAARGLPVVE